MKADDKIGECRHGQAPVKLIAADPSREHLDGAAFDIGGKADFVDTTTRLKIRLLEKFDYSHRLAISPL